MLPDYHLHTDFSGDSTTPPRAQIERAIQLGMDSLCITDHHDYDVDSIIDFTLDLDPYMSSLARLQEEYRDRIDVRIGIELGLQVHLKDYFKELTRRYPFDFVIGSTHFIDRKDPAYPEFFKERGEASAYLQYFETTLENVSHLDDYDVAGHIDYIPTRPPSTAMKRTGTSSTGFLRLSLNTAKGLNATRPDCGRESASPTRRQMC